MPRSLVPAAIVSTALCLPVSLAEPSGPDAAPRALTATTFNIRYGSAEDGENRWERRRESVYAVLREGGDILGLQEALPFQVDEIAKALPEFAFENRSRERDPSSGEACPIFWRTDRLELDREDRGTFWLSETPDRAGSRSWDSSLPRIATFVRLVDRIDGHGIYVFNTHLDHRGERARAEGARVIAARIAARKRPAEPVIVLGDFNDGPGSEAVRALVAAGLVDAWRDANPATPERGTFNGWKERVEGERIDFLLSSPGLVAVASAIDARKPQGRWPSDHLPVRATFAPALAPPSPDAASPAGHPGLHQIVAYAPGLWSGAVPEGPEGFESLRRLGVRTIVSVDGAEPDVAAAAARGIRYVHLPIGYDGMGRERTLEIARAIRDLPGPVYVHCHHGKHRSAAATAAAAVSLGLLVPETAKARMAVSGTAPGYAGLFRCVERATVASSAELGAADASFPAVAATPDLVKAMVEIDLALDHLKAIEAAGWKVPADHPDLVPAAEAGRLADLLRNLARDPSVAKHPSDYAERLLKASSRVSELEDSLVGADRDTAGDPSRLSTMLKGVTATCTDCHVKYRD